MTINYKLRNQRCFYGSFKSEFEQEGLIVMNIQNLVHIKLIRCKIIHEGASNIEEI